MATLLSVMGAFADFERALILERQREGVAAPSAVYIGRRPRSHRRPCSPSTPTTRASGAGCRGHWRVPWTRRPGTHAESIQVQANVGTGVPQWGLLVDQLTPGLLAQGLASQADLDAFHAP
jgi:hypothetical protein